jgi:ATP-binding cassette subfamily F protein uup
MQNQTSSSASSFQQRKTFFQRTTRTGNHRKRNARIRKKRAEILEKLNNEADYEKIAVLSADLEKISEQLEEHEMRWLELQEMMS